jgi:HrpA-like RNA helicase
MKAIGIEDVLSFDFMDRPAPELMVQALETLVALGALTDDAKMTVTPLGRKLVAFPVEPMAAKSIVRAMELGVSDDVCAIVAMLSASDNGLFGKADDDAGGDAGGNKAAADQHRAAFTKVQGDHLTLLALYHAYLREPAKGRTEWCGSAGVSAKQMQKVREVEEQLRGICLTLDRAARDAAIDDDDADEGGSSGRKKVGKNKGAVVVPAYDLNTFNDESFQDFPRIRRALASGYFLQTAYWDPKDSQYRTVNGRNIVCVHPASVLFRQKKPAPIVMFNAVITTTRSYMRDVVALKPEWLFDEAPMVFPRPNSSAVGGN